MLQHMMVAEGGEVTVGASGSSIGSNFSSNSTDPYQRMIEWMRHNGAVVSWDGSTGVAL